MFERIWSRWKWAKQIKFFKLDFEFDAWYWIYRYKAFQSEVRILKCFDKYFIGKLGEIKKFKRVLRSDWIIEKYNNKFFINIECLLKY